MHVNFTESRKQRFVDACLWKQLVSSPIQSTLRIEIRMAIIKRSVLDRGQSVSPYPWYLSGTSIGRQRGRHQLGHAGREALLLKRCDIAFGIYTKLVPKGYVVITAGGGIIVDGESKVIDVARLKCDIALAAGKLAGKHY